MIDRFLDWMRDGLTHARPVPILILFLFILYVLIGLGLLLVGVMPS